MKVKNQKTTRRCGNPIYAKHGDAGVDLYSVRMGKDKYQNDVYYTGLAVEIPEGHVGLFVPSLVNLKDKLCSSKCCRSN